MKFLTKKIKKEKKGFTLIETLVAISILLVSIIGPMEIASKGLFSAFYARDEIIAYYLAQEGLEYVRYARDTTTMLNDRNPLLDLDWLYGLEDCFVDADTSTDPDECRIDPTIDFYEEDVTGVDLKADAIKNCSEDGGECSPIGFDEDSGVYSYDSSFPPSKFTRTVLITEIIPDTEVLIESTVSWRTGLLFSSTKTFVLRERLFNWQRR